MSVLTGGIGVPMSRSGPEGSEAYKMPIPRNYSINSLRMDLQNPRFEQLAMNEREAINYMLKAEMNRTWTLARDIVKRGQLNPTELPMVVGAKAPRTVVEGNRRLACLKILADPKLLDNEKLRKRFEKLRDSALIPIPNTMLCVPFPTREEANPWIQLRHTGANEGVGVSGWSSVQNTRFQSRLTGKEPIHAQFVDLVADWYSEDLTIIKNLAIVVETHFSTLKRVLATKAIRDRLGLHFDRGRLLTSVEPKELKPFVTAFLADLSQERQKGSQPWSRVLHSQADRIAYIESYKDKLPELNDNLVARETTRPAPTGPVKSNAPAEQLETPPAISGPGVGDSIRQPAGTSSQLDHSSQPPYSPPSPINRVPAPAMEPGLFSRAEFTNFGPRISQLAGNCKRINLDTSFDVAGVMARVLVELCTDVFLEAHDHPKKSEKDLWRRIKTVLLVLDPLVENEHAAVPDLFAIYRNINNANQGLAVRTMHAFVHEAHQSPSPTEARFISGLFGPMLSLMNKNLGSAH